MVGTVALVAIAALLAVVAILQWPVGPMSRWLPTPYSPIVGMAARLGLVVLAILILRRVHHQFVCRWDNGNADKSPGPPEPESLGTNKSAQYRDIDAAMKMVREKYSAPAIGLFMQMLTGSAYRTRVTERAELLGNSIRLRATVNHAVSARERKQLVDAKSTCLPVPLIKLTKGTLLDNFEVSSSASESLATLPQQEVRGLIALSLELLFVLTFEAPHDVVAHEEKEAGGHEPVDEPAPALLPRSEEAEAALWSLRRLVCRIGRIGPRENGTTRVGRVSENNIDKIFSDAVKDLQAVDTVRLGNLRDFCRYFALNYVIAVEIPTPEALRFVIKYLRDIPIHGRAYDDDGKRRTRLGLNAYRVMLPLNLAFTAASYHFRMDNGENQFVSHHYIHDSVSGHHVEQDTIRKNYPNSYVRIRHDTGLPYAHLYTRGLSRAQPQEWSTVVVFEETPPGALGATLVVAAVSAALISPMSFISASLPSNGPSADTAALLLAVPLFAATLVGHSVERVQRSSLVTYVSLACTGAIAFVSAILFGVMPNDWLVVKNVRPFDLVTIPGVNVGGLVLSIVAAGNVVFLYWVLRYRTNRFMRMLGPRPTQSVANSH